MGRSTQRKGSEMERIFALKWADELGETWMNKDNLETLLRTKGFVDSRIQFEIEDITDDRKEDRNEEEIEEKPKKEKEEEAKPMDLGEPSDKADEQCRICRFKVSSKCHRRPPTVVVDATGAKQYLNPSVQDAGWCGEFAPALTTES